MTCAAVTVEEWKQANAGRLIDCRWGCRITRDACRSYQSRTARYVLHFNGDHQPLCRANAEYVSCFLPGPCPHLISDEEASFLTRERNAGYGLPRQERRSRQHEAKRRNRLVDPDAMLAEGDSHRSLLTK